MRICSDILRTCVTHFCWWHFEILLIQPWHIVRTISVTTHWSAGHRAAACLAKGNLSGSNDVIIILLIDLINCNLDYLWWWSLDWCSCRGPWRSRSGVPPQARPDRQRWAAELPETHKRHITQEIWATQAPQTHNRFPWRVDVIMFTLRNSFLRNTTQNLIRQVTVLCIYCGSWSAVQHSHESLWDLQYVKK